MPTSAVTTRALVRAGENLRVADRPAEVEHLRRVLVEAGEIDLAREPATSG